MRRRAACGRSTSRCSHQKNDRLTVKHVGFTMVLPLKVGFTYIYTHIYILIYTKRAHPNFRFDRIHMNGASIFEPTDLFIFCFQLRCLFYRDEHGSDISVIPLVGQ